MAQQCGPLPAGAADPGLIDRVDLNGDGLTDYVVDAGRYPCPGRPAISAAAGAQVTMFKGLKDGFAVPAFQAVALGSSLHRPSVGPPQLWITLSGGDCGTAHCERQVAWDVREGRFAAAAAEGVKAW